MASDIIRRSSQGERFLVTWRGRPVSVLLPIDDELEDFILANATQFVRMRERARREYRAGKTTPWSKLRRELIAEENGSNEPSLRWRSIRDGPERPSKLSKASATDSSV